jgi:hypothetical protein
VREDRRFSREEITTVVVGPVSCANDGDDDEDEDWEDEEEEEEEKKGEEATRTMRRKSRFSRLPTVTKVTVGHPHVALKYECEVLHASCKTSSRITCLALNEV